MLSPNRDLIAKSIHGARDIGAAPSEDEPQRLRRRLLLLGGALMACGGLLWGTICVVLGYPDKSAVPYGYVVLTVVDAGGWTPAPGAHRLPPR